MREENRGKNVLTKRLKVKKYFQKKDKKEQVILLVILLVIQEVFLSTKNGETYVEACRETYVETYRETYKEILSV